MTLVDIPEKQLKALNQLEFLLMNRDDITRARRATSASPASENLTQYKYERLDRRSARFLPFHAYKEDFCRSHWPH
jgi:hypothetical protein